MNKISILLLTAFLFTGCATATERVGSDGWHEKRIAEIEQAYQDKEIDKATYLELKTEADRVNAVYQSERRHRSSHVGYRHGRGTHVGIGVGF